MSRKILVMVSMVAGILVLAGSAEAESSVPAEETKKPELHHVVAAGESLSIIAENYKLESWRPLWNVNKSLTNPDLIDVGQDLIVPDGTTEERPLPQVAVAVVPAQTYSSPVVKTYRSSAPANYAAGSGDVFARIRAKESGGNYAINTGNGYYGAYQFDLSTWRGVGGTGLPSDASPAEQDARAAALYAKRGCNPWPNTCS